jgi:translation initiation factor 1
MSNNKTVWTSGEGDWRKKKDLTPGLPHRGAPRSPEKRGEVLPPKQQSIYLYRESAGRRGKAVTLVKNLELSAEEMKSLAKRLKQECGTGGTVKDGVIEIQGEHRERIAGVLIELGYRVKIAGG